MEYCLCVGEKGGVLSKCRVKGRARTEDTRDVPVAVARKMLKSWDI